MVLLTHTPPGLASAVPSSVIRANGIITDINISVDNQEPLNY